MLFRNFKRNLCVNGEVLGEIEDLEFTPTSLIVTTDIDEDLGCATHLEFYASFIKDIRITTETLVLTVSSPIRSKM